MFYVTAETASLIAPALVPNVASGARLNSPSVGLYVWCAIGRRWRSIYLPAMLYARHTVIDIVIALGERCCRCCRNGKNNNAQ